MSACMRNGQASGLLILAADNICAYTSNGTRGVAVTANIWLEETLVLVAMSVGSQFDAHSSTCARAYA